VSAIATALVLAAGEGARLRPSAAFKPLCPVGGTPLLAHALHGLHAAGLARAVIVVGFGADAIHAFLEAQDWPLAVETVRNDRWELPNGVSALAARASASDEPCLLVMADHLVEPALYREVRSAGAGEGLRLGVDRNLGQPNVDLEDVTRVRASGDRIVAIGKGLEDHDAFDTGVFAVGAPFFAALAALDQPSITEGVRSLARDGLAAVVDCSAFDWIDVDDAAALAKAEAMLESWRSDAVGSRAG
jgi:1L-myo-inositol 1-phosphate cytidylyltransferase